MRKFSSITWRLFLSFFAYGFTVFAIGPCLTSIQETYGVSRHTFGMIFSAFAFSFAVASPLGGYMSERWGKKMVLMAGLVLYGVSLILFAAAPSFTAHPIFALAIIIMILNGAAGCWIELNVSSLAADVNPECKGLALNALQVAFGIGAISSPLIISTLFSRNLPWQIIYYLGGVVAILIWILLALEETPRGHSHEERISRSGMGALARSPVVWALTVAMVLYVGAETSFADWQSDFLEKGLHSSRSLASAVPSLFWFAMTLGRVVVSTMEHRLHSRKSLVVMGLGGAVAVFIASQAQSIPVALAGIFAGGLFFAGGFGMVLTYSTERFGLHTGPVFSFLIAGVGVGSATVPAFMGVVADRWSISTAMLIPACVILGLALLFMGIHHLPDPAWEAYLASRETEPATKA